MVDDNKFSITSIYEIETIKRKMNIKKVLILIIAILCLAIAIYFIMNRQHKYEETSSSNVEISKEGAIIEEVKSNEEEEKLIQILPVEQKNLPQLTEEGKINVENIYHSETKRAFLTFDDGPSANTPRILEILDQENIKATFFTLGSQVEAYPAIAKSIYEKGHYIASHGYSHVYSKIYASPQAVLDEYNASVQAIKNALGEPKYDPHLFRFPGGLAGGKYADIKSQAKELLLANNIVNIDWNALNGDGETNKLTPEFEMNRLKETVGEKNSIVVLMHDASAKTVTTDTLPQIIAYLKEQGYEFKNFYDIIK